LANDKYQGERINYRKSWAVGAKEQRESFAPTIEQVSLLNKLQPVTEYRVILGTVESLR